MVVNHRCMVWSLAALALWGLLFAGAIRPAQAEELAERVGKLEAKIEDMQKGGLNVGGFRFIPYGFIKVDAAYDSAKAFNGDFYAWVLQETNRPSNLASQGEVGNDAFSLTANQSRLDLKVIAPKYGEVETYGLFEIDFYGNLINKSGITATGGPDNRPSVLVRHAFIEMRRGTWGLLIGQTHDPISLQWEDTWNYFVGWMAGNPGYRRPQVRVIKDVPLPDGSKLSIWAGIMRTIEDTGWVQSGEESGWPTTFGRVAYQKPMLGKELLVAFDGHYGKEEARNANPGSIKRELTSWSGNVELIVPLPCGFWFKGEGFYGSILGSYYAGIGQSINTGTTASPTLNAIHSWGGWGQLGWVASDKLRLHVGASVDNPRNSDLAPTTIDGSGNLVAGGRSLNRVFYGNFMYSITPAVTAGYEVTQAMTQYVGGPNGIDLRHQVSAMYKF